LSFLISAASAKAASGMEPAAGHFATAGPSATVEAHGIEVEGLDASAWSVPTDAAPAVVVMPSSADVPATGLGADSEVGSAPAPAASMSARAREYKILSSRDKCFEGKFDLARMEDVLNQLGRHGWAGKAMTTTHLKGYTGALEEVIVVLLERGGDAS
jgi:hypothetical protein